MSCSGSPGPDRTAEIMGSMDEDGRYVIADISEDEAWLSVADEEAAPLDAWR